MDQSKVISLELDSWKEKEIGIREHDKERGNNKANKGCETKHVKNKMTIEPRAMNCPPLTHSSASTHYNEGEKQRKGQSFSQIKWGKGSQSEKGGVYTKGN